MNRRCLVDANVIIRHLVQDQREQARAAAALLAACDRGELTAVLIEAVLAECIFVLESFYGHARNDIVRVLTALIQHPGIELAAAPSPCEALARYGSSGLHFVDCLLASTAAATATPIATFDRKLRAATGVTAWPWPAPAVLDDHA